MTEIRAPLQAQIVQWHVAPGDPVKAGDLLVIVEAVKMEQQLRASHAGRVTALFFKNVEWVTEGDALLNI